MHGLKNQSSALSVVSVLVIHAITVVQLLQQVQNSVPNADRAYKEREL